MDGFSLSVSMVIFFLLKLLFCVFDEVCGSICTYAASVSRSFVTERMRYRQMESFPLVDVKLGLFVAVTFLVQSQRCHFSPSVLQYRIYPFHLN